QGTALVMIAPNVLIGFYRYHQKNHIDLRSVAAMSLFSMVATYFSARYASNIRSEHLHVAFALFLIALAVFFAWELKRKLAKAKAVQAQADVALVALTDPLEPAAQVGTGRPDAVMPKKALVLLGLVSGAMSGIFTVGGGLVVVPALSTLFGMAQTRAQGMALALVVPGAVIALFTYAQAGNVSWVTGLPLALGGIFSVSWGVALAHKFSAVQLRIWFCAVLLLTALMMLLVQ
ncbi:MAG: sulfite exporter TauE/SafE family protein, partial [Janthinobacterium lividum]